VIRIRSGHYGGAPMIESWGLYKNGDPRSDIDACMLPMYSHGPPWDVASKKGIIKCGSSTLHLQNCEPKQTCCVYNSPSLLHCYFLIYFLYALCYYQQKRDKTQCFYLHCNFFTVKNSQGFSTGSVLLYFFFISAFFFLNF
jgi:hypothetical protein